MPTADPKKAVREAVFDIQSLAERFLIDDLRSGELHVFIFVCGQCRARGSLEVEISYRDFINGLTDHGGRTIQVGCGVTSQTTIAKYTDRLSRARIVTKIPNESGAGTDKNIYILNPGVIDEIVAAKERALEMGRKSRMQQRRGVHKMETPTPESGVTPLQKVDTSLTTLETTSRTTKDSASQSEPGLAEIVKRTKKTSRAGIEKRNKAKVKAGAPSMRVIVSIWQMAHSDLGLVSPEKISKKEYAPFIGNFRNFGGDPTVIIPWIVEHWATDVKQWFAKQKGWSFQWPDNPSFFRIGRSWKSMVGAYDACGVDGDRFRENLTEPDAPDTSAAKAPDHRDEEIARLREAKDAAEASAIRTGRKYREEVEIPKEKARMRKRAPKENEACERKRAQDDAAGKKEYSKKLLPWSQTKPKPRSKS